MGDATAATEFTKLHQLWAASQGSAGDTIGDVDLRQMAASRFVAYREVRFLTEILDDFRRFVDEIWRF